VNGAKKMNLKYKRSLPLAITLVTFLLVLVITIGNQPIVAYFVY
jgi:hypothetical protein